MDWKRTITLLRKDDFIINQAMKNNEKVYGSQSIRLWIGSGLSREPGDWDLKSRNPKRSAEMLEKSLDKSSGGDNYFVKASSYHRGTFKVKEKGLDDKKGTSDDLQVADYTQENRSGGIVWVRGLQIEDINKTFKDKMRSVSNPEFRYRYGKDSDDLNRIRFFRLLNGRR